VADRETAIEAEAAAVGHAPFSTAIESKQTTYGLSLTRVR